MNTQILNYLQDLGFNSVSPEFYKHIEVWKQWYKGNVSSFHNYEQYNGVKKIKRRRKRLNMAKKICEDKANLLLNEKVSINLSDENSQEFIDKVFYDNEFRLISNRLIELSSGLGTGAFMIYLDGENIGIDTIMADSIFPLSWKNGKISECAFASQEVKGGDILTYITIHTIEDGEYVIYNKLLALDSSDIAIKVYGKPKKKKSSSKVSQFAERFGMSYEEKLVEIPLPDDVCEVLHTGSNLPWFYIITPNIANNVDLLNPMGISIFANSIDILKGIDLVYDSYDNEFVLGKKRIFIDNSLVQVDTEEGRVVPRFDNNDAVFYALSSLDGQADGIREIDMNLRIEEHEMALSSRLNTLACNCGFGKNFYQFKSYNVKTATEVISENSELYRMIKKDEIVLEKALSGVVKTILFIAESFLSIKLDTDCCVNIGFDDSIIEDSSTMRNYALSEYKAGIIDRTEYLKRVYSLTLEQAISLSKEIDERK